MDGTSKRPASWERQPCEEVSLGYVSLQDPNPRPFQNQARPDVVRSEQTTDRSLIEVLRVIWWGQIREGHRMPAEKGVILIDGGLS